MFEVRLTEPDVAAIGIVVAEVTSRHTSVEEPDFLRLAGGYAQELPRGLREPLNEFRLAEPSGGCLITGYTVDDERIGDTPAHWDSVAGGSTLAEEIFFFLTGSLLGEPFGWATEQNQRVMHDVLPIRGHENRQINSASEALIWWHTEDAFHPYRADYVGLMALRNPDKVETSFVCVDDLQLAAEHVEVLFQPRFVIKPDESHRPDESLDRATVSPLLERSYQRIEHMLDAPEKVAVLFGDPASPYLRLDPYFMDRQQEDAEAMRALDAIIEQIDAKLGGVALAPGDIVFVDNYRAVHGRRPFVATYDGKDRWLKRLNVTRDLRKSRDSRQHATSRVLF